MNCSSRLRILTAFFFLTNLFYLLKVGQEWMEVEKSRWHRKENQVTTNCGNVDAQKRFSTRREQMQNRCKIKHQEPVRTKWKVRLNFLIEIESRLLVCAVPKSGSSSWHSIIWAIRRNRLGLDQDKRHYTANDTKRNLGIASMVTVEDGNRLIQKTKGDDDFTKPPPANSSFRLILARHPFARFISGWNQKFLITSQYWVFLFKTYKTLLHYRKTPTEHHVMAFTDFAKFVVNQHGDGKYFDSHFHPATSLCHPCEYDYTYVLKAESLEHDEAWLMRRLNLTQIDTFRSGIGPGRSSMDKNVTDTIKTYISLLEHDTIKRLYKLYEADFDFFGYTFNFTTLEAGGFE